MLKICLLGQITYLRSPRCELWYQRVLEESTTELKTARTFEPEVIGQRTQVPRLRSRKRQWKNDEESDDNPALFRRVRVRYWDQEDDVWPQAEPSGPPPVFSGYKSWTRPDRPVTKFKLIKDENDRYMVVEIEVDGDGNEMKKEDIEEIPGQEATIERNVGASPPEDRVALP